MVDAAHPGFSTLGPMSTHLTADQEQAITFLLTRQSGAIARWQLRWIGLSNASASRLTGQRAWIARHPGVFQQARRRDELRSRMWAALLSVCRRDLDRAVGLSPSAAAELAVELAGEEAVVTGWSAAADRGLVDAAPPTVSLLVGPDQHRWRDEITVVRGLITPEHWSRSEGLLVATPGRAMWDTAWLNRAHPQARGLLHRIAVGADRTRQFAVDELCGLVEEPSSHDLPPRVPRLLRTVAEDLRPGFSHSATEAVAREIVTEVAAELGLVVEPRPFPLYRDGVQIAEADIAIASLRLDLEVDGPHHAQPAQQRRDEKRDARLHTISWTVVRFLVALIDNDPVEFRRRVRALLIELVRAAA